MMTPRSSFARRTRLFWWSLSGIMIAALLLTACGGGGTTATATPTTPPLPTATPTTPPTATATLTTVKVTIVEKNEKYSFSPTALTIKAGTAVVWTNTSDAPHTVTSDQAGVFATDSPITNGQTFSFTFTTAGTFAYHCSIHPYMKASITVTS